MYDSMQYNKQHFIVQDLKMFGLLQNLTLSDQITNQNMATKMFIEELLCTMPPMNNESKMKDLGHHFVNQFNETVKTVNQIDELIVKNQQEIENLFVHQELTQSVRGMMDYVSEKISSYFGRLSILS